MHEVVYVEYTYTRNLVAGEKSQAAKARYASGSGRPCNRSRGKPCRTTTCRRSVKENAFVVACLSLAQGRFNPSRVFSVSYAPYPMLFHLPHLAQASLHAPGTQPIRLRFASQAVCPLLDQILLLGGRLKTSLAVFLLYLPDPLCSLWLTCTEVPSSSPL